MPGVATEKGGFAGLQALHLAGARIGDHQRPAQHVVDDVGGEDGAEGVGVAKSASRRQPVDELMNAVAGDVDPVRHFARVLVAPEMAGDGLVMNGGWPIEGRPGRRLVRHVSAPGS